MVNRVVVVGGGSAGFLAAITFKARLRDLSVTVVRSKEIGIIGVGEGSTLVLTRHLHGYLGIPFDEFYRLAEPQWKLGIRFLWGRRPFFDYSFASQFNAWVPGLSKAPGFYCASGDGPLEYAGLGSALMSHDAVFPRGPNGSPATANEIAYHLENEKFVGFLEGYARRLGVEIRDDTVTEVLQAEAGVAGVRLASGGVCAGDLFIDCSGFTSLLLGRTLGEPFESFKTSLFCDRAVVGGWAREAEPIKPYTTAETMESGWCWQIEHEHRINRGYVYSSSFVSDDAAEREFRAKNPKVNSTRVVRYVSGRYARSWVKNVVAVGNAGGFVEPLESTSLGFICTESVWLVESLIEADRELRPSVAGLFNRRVARAWDAIRQFLAIHYQYNTRYDTPFWRACRHDTDPRGAADVVDFYRHNGPGLLHGQQLLDPDDQFTLEGYWALLVGQQVPYETPFRPPPDERQAWDRFRESNRAAAARAFDAREALALIRAGRWPWPANLYPRLCQPATGG